MKFLFYILCAALHTWVRLLGGTPKRQLVAEVVALRAQLILAKRKTPRASKIPPLGRLLLACVYSLIPKRIHAKTLILVKPATVLKFHQWLVNRKYSRLYRNHQRKAGRPPLSKEIKNLILELKTKNPSFGCPQIASLILDRTGLSVSEETVRRTLMKFYRGSSGGGPSWLSFLGTQANSLWSLDLFQAESICLKTHWVLVVMDQWSRRIVGFAVSEGSVTSIRLTEMFSTCTRKVTPRNLSHDHDPIFNSNHWKRMLAVLQIDEIWSVPFVPISHPYIERMIGTVRRELLDRTLFWNARDLLKKLETYQAYFNQQRVHSGIGGKTPDRCGTNTKRAADPMNLQWNSFCQGLFNVPIAA